MIVNNSLTRGNKAEIVGWGMPNWEAGIEIAANYTAPSNGWIFASGSIGNDGTVYQVKMNGGPIPMKLVGYNGDWAGTAYQVTIPVKAGDVLAFPLPGAYKTFYPCRTSETRMSSGGEGK